MIERVRFAPKAPFPRKVAKKACIREGLAFEADAQLAIDKMKPLTATAYHSQWLEYYSHGQKYHAQPDLFILGQGVLWIFEMKLRHTPRSAKQLSMYGELLSLLYPGKTIKLVEVYKYWDWVTYPAETITLTEEELFSNWATDAVGLFHKGVQ
jgi:hypothetical protein